MIRMFSIVTLLVVSMFVFSDAYAKCKLVKGNTSGVVTDDCGAGVPNGCYSGVVSGSLNGNVELILNSVTASGNPFVGFFLGVTTFTDRSTGDELYGYDSAAGDFDGNGADLLLWNGGTGQFAGAYGHVVIDSKTDFTNLTFETRWNGEICTP
jgi:hypothetical protein